MLTSRTRKETMPLANVALHQCSPVCGLRALIGISDDVFHVCLSKFLLLGPVSGDGSYPAHQEVPNSLWYFSESLWRSRDAWL